MVLRLYDTMTRRKVDFAPLDPERVRMYVCGPTVYDRAHIGNARPVIVFDVLFRLLRHLYGADHVVYARNITDVDDKIIERAAERGVSIRDLTEGTARGFAEDVAALGCLPPTVEPRATEHIPEMIAVVEKLIAAGHAYEAQGHVLFDVPSMPAYGRLSNRSLDEMIAGARVEVAPYKRSDADFVLWKPAAEAEPGWESPWGRGRPGWHLECSAMSWKHLGESFDIHGGGIDLIFPHHENEVAQSCCAFDRPSLAQVWMHNGFLQVEGKKMSKSLGNFVTIHDILKRQPKDRFWGNVLRLNMLKSHYRQPIDWTERSLNETRSIHSSLLSAVRGKERGEFSPDIEFVEKLSDDLNTPAAIQRLQYLAKEIHVERDIVKNSSLLISSLELLGLDRTANVGHGEPISHYVTLNETVNLSSAVGHVDVATGIADIDPKIIEEMIDRRNKARKAKDWAASDRIRDALAAEGIILKDNKDGTTSWSVGRKGAD